MRLTMDGQSCERCKAQTLTTIGSMFNTQMICPPCKTKEEAHPEYALARQAEGDAVKAGDMNFPGIGLPADLR